MTPDVVKAAIKYAEDNKIPYDVVMDNVIYYSVGREDSAIAWLMEQKMGCCIRSNPKPNQAEKPLMVSMFDMDHIASIDMYLKDPSDIEALLSSYGKADAGATIKEYFESRPLIRANITASKGDLGKWKATISTKPGLLSDEDLHLKEKEDKGE